MQQFSVTYGCFAVFVLIVLDSACLSAVFRGRTMAVVRTFVGGHWEAAFVCYQGAELVVTANAGETGS